MRLPLHTSILIKLAADRELVQRFPNEVGNWHIVPFHNLFVSHEDKHRGDFDQSLRKNRRKSVNAQQDA